MARPHKYVKREGAPGKYRYWYKDPQTGKLVEDNDAGKNEHARRLIAGKVEGHHDLSTDEMAKLVGITSKRLREHISNMRQIGRRKEPGAEEHAKHGHEFEPQHLKEAHKEVGVEREDAEKEAHKTKKEGPQPKEKYSAKEERAKWAAAAENTGRDKFKVLDDKEERALSKEQHAEYSKNLEAHLKNQLKNSGLFDPSEIKEIIDGVKIKTPGDIQEFYGGRGGGIHSLYGWAQPRIVEQAIENAKNGMWEGGLKYPMLKGKEGKEDATRDAWLAKNGFTKRVDYIDKDYREGGKHVQSGGTNPHYHWVNPKTGVVISGEFGGYMGVHGPVKESRKVFEQILKDSQYVKDVNGYDNGLGGNLDHEEYKKVLSEAKKQTTPFEGGGSLKELMSPKERAKAAKEKISSPHSPAAKALSEVEPAFAASEKPIKQMIEAQAKGKNPYLERALDIFHSIQSDLKPERKAVVEHSFAAINALVKSKQPLNEANFLSKYKELSGAAVRGISGVASEFEKGSFMTLSEVLENKPVDVEMERMKRGYAAKQYARMKPYLKSSFLDKYPKAPPPYPTFGDVKSWTEHGGTKPSWAGSTRLAVPKEVHEAVHSKDGKPQYPPSWMPIHLMPVWNYVSKSAESNPYAAKPPSLEGGRVALGSQASFQEGQIVSALRKYVQMRGGAEQLVDIPHSKLSEVGLKHHEIFKGIEGSLKQILRTKIIDPVALTSIIQEEMEGNVKKSFELVIEADASPVIFRKAFTVELTEGESIRKARIEKLKRLINEKSA